MSKEAVELVGSDPEIRDAAKALVLMLFAEVEKVLKYGNASDRMALVRSSVPALMMAATRTEEDEGAIKMKADLDALMAEVRGYSTVVEKGVNGVATVGAATKDPRVKK